MKILEKEKIRTLIMLFIIVTIIEILIITLICNYKDKKVSLETNILVSSIISKIKGEYPNVSEEEIISIINSNQTDSNNTLAKYGIDINKTSILDISEKYKNQNTIMIVTSILVMQIIYLIIFIWYIKYKERKIYKITEYLKEINNKNYSLKINDISEGELSKLENELYTITIMLKEEAENSTKDKLALSNSIADISHQLKTPLTSISIMLENLNENKNMDDVTKNRFIKEITKQIEWMKWLVISLLKISKLDADAVNFKNEEIIVKELMNNVKKNMSIPLEIKNLNLIIEGNDETSFIGDYNWELEAITNIVKNCIEHTSENKSIRINYSDNNLYTKIVISDEGSGIDKKDLPHIFERFYKGKNSSSNSVGIGLALSKTIIEKNYGSINCYSELKKGTTFEIKFMKKL